MHDREKSHFAIVAAMPTNKAGSVPAAEPVEPWMAARGSSFASHLRGEDEVRR